ncbi:hypothetical protein Tco_1420351 [Tanacetum coccineum]
MCKAYDDEPNVDLLRAFLNLGPTEMDLKSFMMEGIDGEFNFLPKGCLNDERSSPSAKSVNNEAPTIDAEPITIVGTSSKAVGKRKQVVDTFRDGPRRKTQKVPPQASKTSCDASNPLDVDSNPDIHEREVEKDKAYAELERKFNEALQDLEKNPIVLDMRSKI